MLRLCDVSLTLGGKQILQNLSLEIVPGQAVDISGQSGSGKSVILHLLIGMLPPTQGSVEVDGANLLSVPDVALPLYRKRLGIMLQDRLIEPSMTVAENIAFPLSLHGVPAAELQMKTARMMDTFGISSLAHARGSSLSNGERTLVALARALITDPLILLLDEPLEGFTEAEKSKCIGLLKSLHAAGKTLVTVSRAGVAELGGRSLRLLHGTLTSSEPVQKSTDGAPDLSELARSALMSRGKLNTGPVQRKIRVTSINS